ncbi:hypothetical protein ZIOFF_002801 [Zingiber officinale]|uniref:LYR motif containing domain-containing protein n=1 Tax=Zingiber officinale TaxID=94328 RepID=A0A8J5LZD3_ZINOF|nr:hypothetical protein ZIOFF_002801 [Zingiber officinale]
MGRFWPSTCCPAQLLWPQACVGLPISPSLAAAADHDAASFNERQWLPLFPLRSHNFFFVLRPSRLAPVADRELCDRPQRAAVVRHPSGNRQWVYPIRMGTGFLWATAEDLAKNRGRVLSLYRQLLRCLNSPELPLTHAARLAKKAEVRSIFLFGAEERSLHNIAELIDTANYSISILKKGRLP